MQSPRLPVFAGVAALAAAFLVLASPALGEDKAPQQVTIDDCQAKKPAVAFPHAVHVEKLQAAGKDCKTCHHTGDTSKACATCHREPQGKLGTCADMSPTKNPFHVTCLGCHREMAKTGKSGPTKCNDCHKSS